MPIFHTLRFLKNILAKMGKLPSVVLTFFVAMMGWVFFRAENMGYAFSFIRKLFAFDGRYDEFYCDRRFWFVFALAVIFSFMGYFKKVGDLQYELYTDKPNRWVLLGGSAVAVVLYDRRLR